MSSRPSGYWDWAPIDVAAAGDSTIVPALSGRSIRVLSVVLACAGAVSVRWKDSDQNNISGAMSFAANGGYAEALERGLFQTGSGAGLLLNLSGAVGVSGHLSYIAV